MSINTLTDDQLNEQQVNHVCPSTLAQSVLDRLDQIAATPKPNLEQWAGYRVTTAEDVRQNLAVVRLYPEQFTPKGPSTRTPALVGTLCFETAALVALELNLKRMNGRKPAKWLAVCPDGGTFRVIELNPSRYGLGDWSPLCPRDFPIEAVIRTGLNLSDATTLSTALNKELLAIAEIPRLWHVIVVPLMLPLEAPTKSDAETVS